MGNFQKVYLLRIARKNDFPAFIWKMFQEKRQNGLFYS